MSNFFRHTLLKNVLSLSSVHAANYFVPLLIFPYLVRVIGPAKFGEIAFAQAFVQYFILATDYGFSHTGAREVALRKDSLEQVGRFVGEVVAVKSTLFAGAIAVIGVLCLWVPPFNTVPELYLFTFGMVAAEILFQHFFFQGIEEMKYIAWIGLSVRAASVVCIFLLITSTEHYLYVPLIYSTCYIIGGVAATWIMVRKLDGAFHLPDLSSLAKQFRRGLKVFGAGTAISFQNSSNVVILRAFAAPEVVGLYAAAEKIVMALLAVLNPISTSLLPHIVRKAKESIGNAMKDVRLALVLSTGGGVVLTLVLYLFAEPIARLMLGEGFSGSIVILQILAFIPAGYWIALLIGNLHFLAFGRYTTWSRLFTAISIGGVLVSLVFVGLEQSGEALAISIVVRVYLAALLVYALYRFDIPKVWNDHPGGRLA